MFLWEAYGEVEVFLAASPGRSTGAASGASLRGRAGGVAGGGDAGHPR